MRKRIIFHAHIQTSTQIPSVFGCLQSVRNWPHVVSSLCLEKMLHNTAISKIGTIAFGGKLDPCIQQETVQNNAVVLRQFALVFRTL
jgi:hypothetical protein